MAVELELVLEFRDTINNFIATMCEQESLDYNKVSQDFSLHTYDFISAIIYSDCPMQNERIEVMKEILDSATLNLLIERDIERKMPIEAQKVICKDWPYVSLFIDCQLHTDLTVASCLLDFFALAGQIILETSSAPNDNGKIIYTDYVVYFKGLLEEYGITESSVRLIHKRIVEPEECCVEESVSTDQSKLSAGVFTDKDMLLEHIKTTNQKTEFLEGLQNEIISLKKPVKPNVIKGFYVILIIIGLILIFLAYSDILHNKVLFYVLFGIAVAYEADIHQKQRIFREQEEQLLKAYQERLEKLVAVHNEESNKLIEFTIIPSKYLNPIALSAFEAYLLNQRADTLKEAINLYEHECQINESLILQRRQLELQREQLQSEELIAAGLLCILIRK